MITNLRQHHLRQISIVLCALIFALISIRSFYEASLQKPEFLASLLLGGLSLSFAYVIAKQYRWALRLAAAVLLGLAVFLPIGLLAPFTAGDYLSAGKEPPPLTETLLWLIPLEISLLWIVFLIDPGSKKPGKSLP